MMSPNCVAVARVPAGYACAAPFDPGEAFPEFRKGTCSESGENPVFRGVQECLHLVGLDMERFGRADWNPLGRWIKPGMTVLLKPNWVKFRHPRDPEGWRYTITHPSLIRVVAEYVAIALQGEGEIVVGDAPQTDSSFEEIVMKTGMDRVAQEFQTRGIDFSLVDFRRERWDEEGGVIVARHSLPGDPEGYCSFDLAEASRFSRHQGTGRYYGAFYDEEEVNLHHSEGRHEYLLSGTAIKADVVINLPKLKTHKKTGVTLNLKNLVGINGDKNWLPHHTAGDPTNGGDQFPGPSLKRTMERHGGQILRRVAAAVPGLGPRVLRGARSLGKGYFGDTEEVVRSGNWHGNDTTWRMALDLNTCLLYGQADGSLSASRTPKPYLSFVDGILGGEGNGPLNPDPVSSGVVLFGSEPAAVDAACAWLMGFDPERLPVIREAFAPSALPLSRGNWRDVQLVSNHPAWCGPIEGVALRECFHFRPHFGWVGAVERLEG